ncbi:MAG: 3-keto-5-aminohexanoate cleavage protein [Maricaulis sp.]|nr:3-keto-5-aminohexanoate cleavage protein [Maricaulis sp.]
MSEPFIVMCAPNGARRSKSDHPALPITPVELADCAEQVLAAGASILHLHVRDEDGHHTLDVKRYQVAIDAIREKVGKSLIIQVTSESVGQYSACEQMDMIRELRPEAVSIALREICPDSDNIDETAKFFSWMRDAGIFSQVILYDEKDCRQYEEMKQSNAFANKTSFVLRVLGNGKRSERDVSREIKQYRDAPNSHSGPWALCCFGRNEYEAAPLAARLGGHIRVGFENNLWRADGSLAADNAELVKNACRIASQAGRRVASADDVRRLFRLH